MSFRTEKDPLGEKQVPAMALYGIRSLLPAGSYPLSADPGQRKEVVS